MSKILITGVNGFIGSRLAEHLLKAGHQLRGLVRKSSNLDLIKHLDIQLFYGDITNKSSLNQAVSGVEIVVHVAGLASDWGAYEKFHKVNFLGTKNIAEVADLQQVKRFVHISTTALHGFGFESISENYPMPDSFVPYCQTKKLAEQWLFEFAKTSETGFTAIRPGNVFGAKDHTFIDKYLEALESGKIAYVSGGKSLTCPTYIENLVSAIEKACFETAAVGEAFFITDGLHIDWKTFTDKLADEMKVKRPRLSIPYAVAYPLAFLFEKIYQILHISSPPLLTRYRINNGGKNYHFSIQKARNLLKYKPLVDIDTAVARTVKWYKELKIKS